MFHTSLQTQTSKQSVTNVQLLTQLYARDAEWPHIHFPIILALIHGQDHLRSHPTSNTFPAINSASVISCQNIT